MAEVGVGLPDALAVNAGDAPGVQVGGGIGGASAPPRYLEYRSKPRHFHGEESWPRPIPSEGCQIAWGVVYCGCSVRKGRSGCHRKSCPRYLCQDWVRERSARAIERRFEAGRAGKAVIYWIFTVPLHRRAAAADPKTWQKWRKSLIRWMKRECGLWFACERTDPAGDSDKSKWHPHLNILWVQRDGFRPFQDHEKVKRAWADIIGAEDDVFGDPVIDVRLQGYSDGSTPERQAQLKHWFSYMARGWADWRKALTPTHLQIRWYGSYPKVEKERHECEKCGLSFRFAECFSEVEADELVKKGPEHLQAVMWARGRSDVVPEAVG